MMQAPRPVDVKTCLRPRAAETRSGGRLDPVLRAGAAEVGCEYGVGFDAQFTGGSTRRHKHL